MKQLIQNFKTGDLYVDEVPLPALGEGMVLVENHYSLISAGTEKGTVKVAQSNLLGKAKQRPDLVQQVLQNIKKEGLKATLEKVRTKLDSLKALGYSTAGTVIASSDTSGDFKPGDRVACAGQDYASHAEVVSIPQNLTVKIPDHVSFEEASFTTLGSIALQGVRQANPQLGNNICVIGLGLLGQITCQLLKANGCNVFGVDVSPYSVNLTNKIKSAHCAINRNAEELISSCNSFTGGYGFDQVIITAAAPTNDPIVLASEIIRKKGKVVIVGAVKMDIPRDPHFYRKELELVMSCSYGPGRYDTHYEENGIDYPYSYVRWTEKRNMEAFLQLIATGNLNLRPLITHTFYIEEAEKAYDIVLGKTEEKFLGILLGFQTNKEKLKTSFSRNNNAKQEINVGFIGAGSFAQSYLIPHVKKAGSLDTVVTSKGITSINVTDKFGFNNSSTNSEDIINNKNINTVFIATRHDSHSKYVIAALMAEKNVFVEKPLALNYSELEEVKKAYYSSSTPKLMVGFNRRFAPVCVKAKQLMEGFREPFVFNFRINAGFIPKEHWIQDEKAGGGRIVGEMCHFIDLMQYFCDALPTNVYANCISVKNELIKNDDNIAIVIHFSDGSIGNLIYVANGDKAMPKEHLELFCAGNSFVINDFRSGTHYSGNKSSEVKSSGKGHAQEVSTFLNSIKDGTVQPIPFESLYYTTLTTLKIKDSLITGLPQSIE